MDEKARLLAALARSLRFEADPGAAQACEDAAKILDAAAKLMFEQKLSVEDVIKRLEE